MIQLLLFILRYFIYYSRRVAPSKAFGPLSPIFTLHGLTTLAYRLRFTSDEINEIKSQSQSRTIAKDFIKAIYRDEFLDLNKAHIKAVSNRFTSILTLLRGNKTILDLSATFTTNDPGESA
jgi:hypothetical protein